MWAIWNPKIGFHGHAPQTITLSTFLYKVETSLGRQPRGKQLKKKGEGGRRGTFNVFTYIQCIEFLDWKSYTWEEKKTKKSRRNGG
jgi:hypothetical protein